MPQYVDKADMCQENICLGKVQTDYLIKREALLQLVKKLTLRREGLTVILQLKRWLPTCVDVVAISTTVL